ncbi:putative toxin-antitoxin system toxin component, PIN family [soil metagenome]
MRIVLDTNVLVSSFISTRSASARILQLFEAEAFELVVSQPLLDEYQAALGYDKVQKLHGMSDAEIEQRVADLRATAIFVTPTVVVQVVSDPDDDMLFAAALEGQAEVIVSGDAAVQAVKDHQGIHVLAPALFLAFLEQQA